MALIIKGPPSQGYHHFPCDNTLHLENLSFALHDWEKLSLFGKRTHVEDVVDFKENIQVGWIFWFRDIWQKDR